MLICQDIQSEKGLLLTTAANLFNFNVNVSKMEEQVVIVEF